MSRRALIYGTITGVVVVVAGWITGMGGSFWPNLLFAAAMGVLAAVCFSVAVRMGGRRGR